MDINFTKKDIKFNMRVAGIFINKDKVLLQKNQKDEGYYSLIGGRVKLLEDTASAFIREVKEETGILLSEEEISLIDVVENFFTYNGTKYHELLFIYKVQSLKINNLDNFNTLDKKESSLNKWYSLKEAETFDIRPQNAQKYFNNKMLNHDVIKEI